MLPSRIHQRSFAIFLDFPCGVTQMFQICVAPVQLPAKNSVHGRLSTSPLPPKLGFNSGILESWQIEINIWQTREFSLKFGETPVTFL